MASTYLTRTFVTPTSNQKFTASFWFKRAGLTNGILLQTGSDYFYFNGDAIDFEMSIGRLKTNRLLRDVSAWYNVIVAVDTTLGTADDRLKMYINGVQETSFASRTNPSQNATLAGFNTAVVHKIGQRQASPGNDLNFDGSMAFVAFIDGKQEAPTVFGETDTTTGEWKIKTSITPTSAWGNNGFFILKDGNSVTDQSGEGHNFTLGGGTLTKTEDCPSNVFATLNTLTYHAASQSNSGTVQAYNGNTTWKSQGSNQWGTIFSTIAPSTGKWYYEVKVGAIGGNAIVGVVDVADARANAATAWYIGQSSTGQGYQNNGAASNGGASYGATYTTGDIIGCAMDLDNSKIYWSKNGTFQNSGVPNSGATGTGALTLTANTNYAFAVTGYNTTTMNCNFGNGYFGTTAVSSAGTNASGNGIFEYDTPTGYTALSTKGLNL